MTVYTIIDRWQKPRRSVVRSLPTLTRSHTRDPSPRYNTGASSRALTPTGRSSLAAAGTSTPERPQTASAATALRTSPSDGTLFNVVRTPPPKGGPYQPVTEPPPSMSSVGGPSSGPKTPLERMREKRAMRKASVKPTVAKRATRIGAVAKQPSPEELQATRLANRATNIGEFAECMSSTRVTSASLSAPSYLRKPDHWFGGGA